MKFISHRLPNVRFVWESLLVEVCGAELLIWNALISDKLVWFQRNNVPEG